MEGAGWGVQGQSVVVALTTPFLRSTCPEDGSSFPLQGGRFTGEI